MQFGVSGSENEGLQQEAEPIKFIRFILPLAPLVIIGGCSESTEEQMEKYLEFYFPSTGSYFYEIKFDWGTYLIVTEAKPGEEVHDDSKPYRGFVTMRPSVAGAGEESFPIYLVTPQGEVWTSNRHDAIPKEKQRKEVVVDGSSTMTSTITSASEPVIDDFLANKAQWKRHGSLTTKGDKSEFERAS